MALKMEAKPFYYDGKPDKAGEYLVILCGSDGPEELAGWYFMVEDEPIGPFETEAAAQDAANEW